jgi:PAS domain S-box-containing protein
MKIAGIPPHEHERLQSLYALNILDTPVEPRFDRITELAAGYFDVPIAIVNMIDADRQWAKSCFGDERGEVERSVSFCAHTILSDQLLVVNDALLDERFHDNPFVTGDYNLRFYAGAPLHAPDGSRAGSLCLVDHKPRSMSEGERRALRQFASLVEDELNRVHLETALERQRVAEASLWRERAQLRAIIDGAPVPMALLDGERRFVAWSDAWRTAYRLPQHDLVGQCIDDVLPESGHRWREIHQTAMRGVYLQSKEECLPLANETICLQWAAAPFRGPEGHISGVVLVTERIDELVEAREAALSATRQKGEFLARMSHEIRTPMNGVIGMLDVLLEMNLTRQQEEYAMVARDSAHQLLSIINDILDLSKIEAGKLGIENVPFVLETTVNEAVNLLRINARTKNLDLRTVFAPGLPHTVLGDGHRLRQVLLNLVSNAIKFTAHGFVHVTVAPLPHAEGRTEIEFAVRDSGIGLSAEAQRRLFKPFEQAESSTGRQYGGSGLGLSICKELITLMGGTISVTSEEGVGSTFRFILPLEPVEPVATAFSVEPASRVVDTQSKLPILLVEDNAINRRLALLQLEKLGYMAQAVENGRQALEAVQHTCYGLVLMDCQMPIMDGFTATTAIRQWEAGEQHTPIIAMTAGVMADERAACMAAGMDDFMSKPIRLHVLQAMIERWIRPYDVCSQAGVRKDVSLVAER